MDVLTDFPERLKPGVQVYWGQDHQILHIRRCKQADKAILVTFEEVHDRESAGLLRNSLVYVRADEIPALPEGEYYHHQILGLRVVSDQGQMLGTVVEILETGANDVVVIRPEVGREILVPLVNDFILRIDLQAGVLHVRLVEGLLPGGPPA
jgi:16S rRNA processing protein RimM